MNNPNQHIDEFLDYYCDLASPQYAVMLKGKWGSGKTHYINEYKERLDNQKKKYIYVSLYGVTSYDEIETKFLEVLHPVLTHKKTILAGKIAKGILKTTIKVDLDGDDKADGSVRSELPSFDAGDLLNTKDYVLIFDDLERCSIDINDLLGYINYFVEHQDYRVILLANDEKFKSKEEYQDIKEKLIGKEFELVSNVELAYDSFVKELGNRKKLKEYKNEIINIYNSSGYNNLRELRQIIYDFDRLYTSILENFRNKKFIEHIIKVYFSFAIENKFNKELFLILNNSKSFQQKEELLKKRLLLSLKYPISFDRDMIFEIDTWDEILNKSLINKKQIEKDIYLSKFYISENMSNYEKLLRFQYLPDEEFKEVSENIYKDLKANKIKDTNHIKNIVEKLLFFNSKSLIKIDEKKLFNIVENNINKIYEDNYKEWFDINYNKKDFLLENIYEKRKNLPNIIYDKEESKFNNEYNFSSNYQHYLKKVEDYFRLKKYEDDINEFNDSNMSNLDSVLIYEKEEVLTNIDINKLAEKISKYSYFELEDLKKSLDERYKNIGYSSNTNNPSPLGIEISPKNNEYNKLLIELEPLKKLKSILTNKVSKYEDSLLSIFYLKQFISDYLTELITKLEAIKKKNEI